MRPDAAVSARDQRRPGIAFKHGEAGMCLLNHDTGLTGGESAAFLTTLRKIVMGKVTESIWSNGRITIALSMVTHIEVVIIENHLHRTYVITGSTTYNSQSGDYNNVAIIPPEDHQSFGAAWLRYRVELEADDQMDLSPDAGPSAVVESWQKLNQRRGHLIDKKISGAITLDERLALEGLQAYAEHYLNRETPLPTSELEKAENTLLGSVSRKDGD